MWLALVRDSGCGPSRPVQPPGRTFHLDGRHATEAAGFWCALGEAVNGPGGYFGCNLDALDDCLGGGFGATAPFTLAWHASHVARRHLGNLISPWDGRFHNYFDKILKVFADHRIEVLLR
ncbi:barstar family protein [Kitasatospora sp. NBC_00240]|uniref:barstar family protein n=1 Tax=Kitasatospora sp. NBC_00240 TaxID=2903567 RepID=UPI00225C1D1D|nr:barstar family protein [Kitasatospora sp. NBC_00240]MCX5214915.1 barstar family protein [Kitasatospora sp. NBC_00240]